MTQSKRLGTALLLTVLLGSSSSVFAGGKLERAIEEHDLARKQLQGAHEELYQKMDRYFDAVSSKNPDPAKIQQAESGIEETNNKIQGILSDAHTRMNTLMQSMKYSMKDGLVEKSDQDQDSGKDISPAEVGSFLAKNAAKKPENEPKKKAESESDVRIGSSSRSKTKPQPTASPSLEMAAPEILNQEGPRQFTFKRAVPASPDPNPTASDKSDAR